MGPIDLREAIVVVANRGLCTFQGSQIVLHPLVYARQLELMAGLCEIHCVIQAREDGQTFWVDGLIDANRYFADLTAFNAENIDF